MSDEHEALTDRQLMLKVLDEVIAFRADNGKTTAHIFGELGGVKERLGNLEIAVAEGTKSIHDRLDRAKQQMDADGTKQHRLERSVNELAEGQRKLARRGSVKAGE